MKRVHFLLSHLGQKLSLSPSIFFLTIIMLQIWLSWIQTNMNLATLYFFLTASLPNLRNKLRQVELSSIICTKNRFKGFPEKLLHQYPAELEKTLLLVAHKPKRCCTWEKMMDGNHGKQKDLTETIPWEFRACVASPLFTESSFQTILLPQLLPPPPPPSLLL